MPSLERRIGALERLSNAAGTHAFILRFVGHESVNSPLASLRVGLGGEPWLRLADEPEEVFVARVRASVPAQTGGVMVLVGE